MKMLKLFGIQGGRFCALISAIVALSVAHSVFADDAYIASATDGKVYSIDTGYVPGPQTAVYADFEFLDVNGKDQQFVFEANGNGNARARIYINGSGNLGWSFTEENPSVVNTQWQSTGIKMNPGTRYKMMVDAANRRTTLEYGDISRSFDFSSNSAESMHAISTIKIFSSAGMSSNAAKMKLYAFKIYEAGELIYDYTPAIKAGIAGLVDSKTGMFIYDTRYPKYNEFTTGGEIPTIDDDPYVASDGTSAINLGVSASPKLKIALDFALLEGNEKQDRLFGQDTKDDLPRFSVYINNSWNIALAGGTDTAFNNVSTGIATNTARHTVVIDNVALRNAYMTGVTTNWSGYGATKADCTKCATRPLALFGNTNADDGSAFTQCTKMKVYGLKIWAGGELIRNLAPRCIDGVAGFEDLAFGGFYTCGGLTASENASTALSNDYTKEGDPWVESDGSFYSIVNTYYMDGANTKVEIDFQLASIVSGAVVAGHFNNEYTCLLYCASETDFVLQAKDDKYVGGALTPVVHQDLARHKAVLDSPEKTFTLYSADGTVEGVKTAMDDWSYTKRSNWPFILFGSATDAYGHNKQRAKARIYSVKFYEKDEVSGEYTLQRTLMPVVVGDVAGFEDEAGNFYSGDGLRAGGAVKTLPSDPYVESPNGGRYFDTGYYVTSNTCIKIDYMPLVQQTSQQFPFEGGSGASATNMYMRIYGNGSAGQGDIAYACGQSGWTSLNVPYAPHVRRQVTVDAYNLATKIETAGQTIRETTITASGKVPEKSNNTLKLLCNSTMNANSCKSRLYGVQIYEEGTLVRDYVPICQGGTYALLDKVNGTVLVKASNSKEFTGYTANNDLNDAFFVADMRDEDAYIESDGTQGINLGYLTTLNTRYEIDYQMTGIVGQMRPFGVAGGGVAAELYIQGSATGSGNVAFGSGNPWKAQTTGVASDLNRHVAVLDLANRECGYSGYKMFAFTSDTVCSETSTIPMWLFAKGTNATGSYSNRTKMKLYAFRIYESGVLVHEYLPYKNGDTVGLYDTMTGNVVTSTVSGSNAFTYGGGLGYGKFAGVKTVLTTDPVDTAVNPKRSSTLTAFAPGAIRYIWTRNGEVIDGEEDEALTIEWQSPKSAGGPVVYAVTPVFSKKGAEVLGEEASAEVTMDPEGLIIILR